jgi:hypothetical protein
MLLGICSGGMPGWAFDHLKIECISKEVQRKESSPTLWAPRFWEQSSVYATLSH